MTASLVAITYDARDPQALASFWGALLERPPVVDPAGVLLRGSATQVGLRFVAGSGERHEDLHLHLTSEDQDQMDRTIARVLELGGAHLDVGQLPEEGHVVLADPEGNPLCVIEPGNDFLAGTGFLGEVACDGLREVGVFWSEALGWPLVWDQDGETAIQSPVGGTKVAWGGPPVAEKNRRNAQRFELETADPAAEAERLIGLGAVCLSEYELADPGGNEFALRTPSTSKV